MSAVPFAARPAWEDFVEEVEVEVEDAFRCLDFRFLFLGDEGFGAADVAGGTAWGADVLDLAAWEDAGDG